MRVGIWVIFGLSQRGMVGWCYGFVSFLEGGGRDVRPAAPLLSLLRQRK
jgi:hypothetical protein